MLENLHRTKEIGHRSRDLLVQGDLDAYAELMHEHWLNKRRRSPGMANERIDDLYTLARRSGVVGGKLVGAGGGGFLLVYAQNPEDTRQAMAAAGATELAFDFEFVGAHVERVRMSQRAAAGRDRRLRADRAQARGGAGAGDRLRRRHRSRARPRAGAGRRARRQGLRRRSRSCWRSRPTWSSWPPPTTSSRDSPSKRC